LIYLKPSISGDEASDLKGHWAGHAEFPHDPTSNQFYDEDMVESYRQLGEHMGEQLCRDLGEAEGIQDLWEKNPLDPERFAKAFAAPTPPRPSTPPSATAAKVGRPELSPN
jgi:hypothetical protein